MNEDVERIVRGALHSLEMDLARNVTELVMKCEGRVNDLLVVERLLQGYRVIVDERLTVVRGNILASMEFEATGTPGDK